MYCLEITIKDILKASKSQLYSDEKLIKKAWEFAEKAHGDQKRLSGEPYISHPATVAYFLSEAGMDKETIAAGILHDTLEDTEITYNDLKENFGDDVARLVKGVTKIGDLKYDKKIQQARSLRNLFIAAAQDIRVIVIKLFDRLHNLETLNYHDSEKQKRKALESLKIYAPIAYRLGMNHLKTQIEDLAFSNLQPEKYKKVFEFQQKRLKEIEQSIDSTLKSIQKELKHNKIKFRTEIRKKGVYSLFKEIKLNRYKGLKSIHDLTPIRVIVQDISSCYQSMGVIHSKFRPLPTMIKDFISFPKPNGRQALYTSVFTGEGEIIEIQIMTEEMNRYANMGIVSDIETRKNNSIFSNFSSYIFGSSDNKNVEYQRKFMKVPAWFKDMANKQKDMKNTDEFLGNLNKDYFNYRILVFTPKGDIVNLPSDSCPIDFAYYVHTDIGNHLKIAEIDGEKVSLNTKLKNGNIVKIATSPDATPSYEWLNYVKTILAKKQIKYFLDKENRKNL